MIFLDDGKLAASAQITGIWCDMATESAVKPCVTFAKTIHRYWNGIPTPLYQRGPRGFWRESIPKYIDPNVGRVARGYSNKNQFYLHNLLHLR